jgi:uncharacterized membrane-anchored protein
MHCLRFLPLLASLTFGAWSCFAQTAPDATPPTPEQLKAAAERTLASLHFKDGTIDLANGVATLNLPAGFKYLNPTDSSTVLEDLWGNPPGDKPLGMIVPANVSLIDPSSWAIVMTFDEDGYVKDHDAATINYDKLLKDMQESTREANKQRKEMGYPTAELIGWAAPPTYDASEHKLHWAKELKFDDDESHTLNYNIRALGRRGVLVLNAIASMDQLGQIQAASPEILGMVSYNPGHRYEDFDGKTDQVAAYGIAALVAGGVAAKAGLFKGLIAAILAAKKIIIAAVIGIGAWLKRAFGRRNEA